MLKLMDLANHEATLKGKRGAAFSVASSADQSSEMLLPYMASLLPKLYRYSCVYHRCQRLLCYVCSVLAAPHMCLRSRVSA